MSGRSTSRSPTSVGKAETPDLVLESETTVGRGQPGDGSVGGVFVELGRSEGDPPGSAAREGDVRRPRGCVGDGRVEGELG